MNNTSILMNRNWLGLLGLALALTAAGCGGGPSGGGGGGGGGGTTGDETPTTAAGTVITAEAEHDWESALTAFNTARAEGWTEAECTDVISGFDHANSTQGGRFTEAVYMIGVTHEACGHADQARDYYHRALEMNDHFCGARVATGIESYRAGRRDEARATFTRATTDDTRCTEGYVNLAIIQRQTAGQAADALNNLRRALAIDSGYLPAFNQMALLYLEQAIARSTEPERTISGGVPAVSGADFEEGSGDDDEHSHRRHHGPRSGSELLALAEVVCRQAQLIDGNFAPIYNTWGLINVRQNTIIAALAKFERAFNLDPTMFEAYMNFGELTLGFRGYEDALAAFTRATELNPNSYDAWIGLGAAHRGLTHVADAEAAYERARAIDANRPDVYFNLGVLMHNFGDGSTATEDRAIAYYREFVSRAGSNEEYAEIVTSVTRECPAEPPSGINVEGRAGATARARHRRWERLGCNPGRIQQILNARAMVAEMARIVAEIEAMGGGASATPPEDGTTPPPADGTTPPPADGAAPPP